VVDDEEPSARMLRRIHAGEDGIDLVAVAHRLSFQVSF
jgi:hypothetical protein